MFDVKTVRKCINIRSRANQSYTYGNVMTLRNIVVKENDLYLDKI